MTEVDEATAVLAKAFTASMPAQAAKAIAIEIVGKFAQLAARIHGSPTAIGPTELQGVVGATKSTDALAYIEAEYNKIRQLVSQFTSLSSYPASRVAWVIEELKVRTNQRDTVVSAKENVDRQLQIAAAQIAEVLKACAEAAPGDNRSPQDIIRKLTESHKALAQENAKLHTEIRVLRELDTAITTLAEAAEVYLKQRPTAVSRCANGTLRCPGYGTEHICTLYCRKGTKGCRGYGWEHTCADR
jgi:hypothetical protein